jgi:hypothetical protein
MSVPAAREHSIEKQHPNSQPRQAQRYVYTCKATGVPSRPPCLSTENDR